jgi:hypothetical protein
MSGFVGVWRPHWNCGGHGGVSQSHIPEGDGPHPRATLRTQFLRATSDLVDNCSAASWRGSC